jgi:hypothetical protein
MPCNRGEPDYDCCEQPNPATPTKLQHNSGVDHYNSDAKNLECQFDSDEPFHKKNRRRVDKQNSELYFVGHDAHDCAEYYPSDFTTMGF